MTFRASLAAVALTTSFAGVAGAQQRAGRGVRAAAGGLRGTAPAGPGAAAPAVRAAARLPHLRRRARRHRLRPWVWEPWVRSRSATNSASWPRAQPELHGPEHDSSTTISCSRRSTTSWRRTLSIGGQLQLGRVDRATSMATRTSTTIGLLPRIGYNFPIVAHRVDLAARLARPTFITATIPLAARTATPTTPSRSSSSVPVVFQPAPHFFIGGGPYLWTDLVSKYDSNGTSGDTFKTTTFGLQSMVGGYFGGT